MFCMAAYILLRFRDISFSVGAFASVAVTTLCIISFYTLLWKVLPFSMEDVYKRQILHSANMKPINCTIDKVRYSDHYPMWCYLQLKEGD